MSFSEGGKPAPKPGSRGSTWGMVTNDNYSSSWRVGQFIRHFAVCCGQTMEGISVSSGASAVSDEEDDLTLGSQVDSLKAFGISLRAVRRPTEGSGTVHQGF